MAGRSTERTLQAGVAFKNIVIGLGFLVLVAWTIWLLTQGKFLASLLIFFIGGPVWYIVADIATGLLIAPFVGTAALRDRRRGS